MNEDPTRAYAAAVLSIAEGEDAVEVAVSELQAVAQAVAGSDELRRLLSDQQLPLGRRLGAVDGELLAAAHPVTRTALAMLLAAERAGELTAVVEHLAELVASDRSLAEVRTAVELDQPRRQALTDALSRATGRELEVRFVVDPDVVGGVRATVGDTVIDGSLLKRMTELRSRVGL